MERTLQQTETMRSLEERQRRGSIFKRLIDKLVSLAGEPESDQILLQASEILEELRQESDPYRQIETAVELSDDAPEEVIDAIVPLIDEASEQILEELEALEHGKLIPMGRKNSSYGAYLSPREIVPILQAHDVAESDTTTTLSEFAADHAASRDLQEMFGEALNLADTKEIPVIDALQIVREEIESKLAYPGQYEWLFDPNEVATPDVEKIKEAA